MSVAVTSPQQFGKIYHGSAHWFSPGDVVEPTDSLHSVEPLAYASESTQTAGIMGTHRARAGQDRANPGQTSMFAPVYEVEHNTSPQAGQRLRRRSGSAVDPAGFTVKRLAGLRSTLSQDYTPLG